VILAALTGSENRECLYSRFSPSSSDGKTGYHKSMIFGPILGAGGLAVLIRPAVLPCFSPRSVRYRWEKSYWQS
jgi:hypothetical protein